MHIYNSYGEYFLKIEENENREKTETRFSETWATFDLTVFKFVKALFINIWDTVM